MKITSPIPMGVSPRTGARNWQTSKGSAYADNYDRIFKRRTNRPGFTVTVYRGNDIIEIPNADQLTRKEAGLAPERIESI